LRAFVNIKAQKPPKAQTENWNFSSLFNIFQAPPHAVAIANLCLAVTNGDPKSDNKMSTMSSALKWRKNTTENSL